MPQLSSPAARVCIQYVQPAYILMCIIYCTHTHTYVRGSIAHKCIRTYSDWYHLHESQAWQPQARLGSLIVSRGLNGAKAFRSWQHGRDGEGGLLEGRISIRCLGFTFVCGFCFQSHAGEGGRPVARSPGRSFAWLIIQIQFACCSLVRSLVIA